MAEPDGLLYQKLQKKYKRIVKKNMEALKTYQPQFDTLINVFAGMLAQFEILTRRLIDSDLDIEVETERGGTRKSATVTAIERLRIDIAAYSDRLCLNPQSRKTGKPGSGNKVSKLGEALSKIDKGGR